MGIQNLTPPRRVRGSKYDFDAEEVQEAIEALNEGGSPGDGPFEKEGEARSAATRLIQQCEGVEGAPEEIGSRSWEDEDGGFWFCLKIGKRQKRDE